MGPGIDPVHSMSHHPYRFKPVLQGQAVCTYIHPVGHPADDHGVVSLQALEKPMQKALALFRHLSGSHNADHPAAVQPQAAPNEKDQGSIRAIPEAFRIFPVGQGYHPDPGLLGPEPFRLGPDQYLLGLQCSYPLRPQASHLEESFCFGHQQLPGIAEMLEKLPGSPASNSFRCLQSEIVEIHLIFHPPDSMQLCMSLLIKIRGHM